MKLVKLDDEIDPREFAKKLGTYNDQIEEKETANVEFEWIYFKNIILEVANVVFSCILGTEEKSLNGGMMTWKKWDSFDGCRIEVRQM